MTALPLESRSHRNHVYLDKQRLAAGVILELAEKNTLFTGLASELYFFRDQIDRALLSPEAAARILPWMDVPAPAPEGDIVPFA